MESWLLWLILAVILALGEVATLGLFLAPFAAGAALAAVADLVGAPDAAAGAVFLVTSFAFLFVARPIARSHRQQPAALRTGTAALIGTSATVVERIANAEGVGAVRINGEVWTARAYDEDHVFEAGTRVQVIEIRGATALVED